MKMNHYLHSQTLQPSQQEREERLLKECGVAINVEDIELSPHDLALKNGIVIRLSACACSMPAASNDRLITSDNLTGILSEYRDHMRCEVRNEELCVRGETTRLIPWRHQAHSQWSARYARGVGWLI
jgi:hypothetical protein